ncbi:MAG: RNA-binding protein [Patescibacteria group bacterium]|nr:RNA-binding protein [Patescibacteria group bacterium]
MDQRDNRDRVFTPAEPNPRLFIGGLAWAATDEDLKDAFSSFGEVVSASVVRFPDTGRSKGFGFVEYSSTEEAQKAKDEMDGKELQGRAIKIDFARPRRENNDRG